VCCFSKPLQAIRRDTGDGQEQQQRMRVIREDDANADESRTMKNSLTFSLAFDMSKSQPRLEDAYGLTNAEDFAQVYSAKVVHIISTPYDKANPVAGRKAVETKILHDNPAKGVYVFNPNTGLRAAAAEHGLSEEEQGQQWLRLWIEVLQVVKKTGGKCFVMAKQMGPARYTLEGGAQSGEVNVAQFALDPLERGHEGPAGWECERIEYVLYSGADNQAQPEPEPELEPDPAKYQLSVQLLGLRSLRKSLRHASVKIRVVNSENSKTPAAGSVEIRQYEVVGDGNDPSCQDYERAERHLQSLGKKKEKLTRRYKGAGLQEEEDQGLQNILNVYKSSTFPVSEPNSENPQWLQIQVWHKPWGNRLGTTSELYGEATIPLRRRNQEERETHTKYRHVRNLYRRGLKKMTLPANTAPYGILQPNLAEMESIHCTLGKNKIGTNTKTRKRELEARRKQALKHFDNGLSELDTIDRSKDDSKSKKRLRTKLKEGKRLAESNQALDDVEPWQWKREQLDSDWEDSGSIQSRSSNFPRWKLFDPQKRPCGFIRCAFEITDQLEPEPEPEPEPERRAPQAEPERVYRVRAYVIKARDLLGNSGCNPYLEATLNGRAASIPGDSSEYKEQTSQPEFRRVFEFDNVTLPGAATLKICVKDYRPWARDTEIGRTEVDLEHRFFCDQWQRYERKPIEARQLMLPDRARSKSISGAGELLLWIDILEVTNDKVLPVLIDISKPLAEPFQLRAIVWSAEELETQKRTFGSPISELSFSGHLLTKASNSHASTAADAAALSAKKLAAAADSVADHGGGLMSKMKAKRMNWKAKRAVGRAKKSQRADLRTNDVRILDQKQQTDVHLRAKEGKGSWNYRMVFDFSVDRTLKKPCTLTLKAWEKHYTTFKSVLIGSREIDLLSLVETGLQRHAQWKQRQMQIDALKDSGRLGEMLELRKKLRRLDAELEAQMFEERNARMAKGLHRLKDSTSCDECCCGCIQGIATRSKELLSGLCTRVSCDRRNYRKYKDRAVDWLGIDELDAMSSGDRFRREHSRILHLYDIEGERKGKVWVSVELLHQRLAIERPAGHGRDEPNQNPILEEPDREKISLLHPFGALKVMFGEALFKKIKRIFLSMAVFALLWSNSGAIVETLLRKVVAMNPFVVIPCQASYARGKDVHAEFCGEKNHFHPQRSHFAECLGPAVPVCTQESASNFTFDQDKCNRSPPCRQGLKIFIRSFDSRTAGMPWPDLLNDRCTNLGDVYSLRYFSEDCRHSHRAFRWVPRMPWSRLCENEPCPMTCISMQDLPAECPPLNLGSRFVKDAVFKLMLPLLFFLAILVCVFPPCRDVAKYIVEAVRKLLKRCWQKLGLICVNSCPVCTSKLQFFYGRMNVRGVVKLAFVVWILYKMLGAGTSAALLG
jgi:hypothetical protein